MFGVPSSRFAPTPSMSPGPNCFGNQPSERRAALEGGDSLVRGGGRAAVITSMGLHCGYARRLLKGNIPPTPRASPCLPRFPKCWKSY